MGTKLDRIKRFSVSWWPLMLPIYMSLVGSFTYLMFIGGTMATAWVLGLV